MTILKSFKTEGQNSYTGFFFLKKIRRRIVFYSGSVTSFPIIILGNFAPFAKRVNQDPEL